ncbi:MAG: PTS sugar transporter subunit IIA, partial [Spirochaetota bacterium]
MKISETKSDLMTLSELAQYLKLAEKTLLRMVHKGEIPSLKVASQWRFKRQMIDDWLQSQMKGLPQDDLAHIIGTENNFVPLSRLTGEDLILTDIHPGSKKEVLVQLIEPLVNKGIVQDREAFLSKLLQREEMVSTAIGRGIAIPHIRRPQDNPIKRPALVIGICKQGTEFDSFDGEPTKLFLLLCAGSEIVHLRVMAKITT